MTGQLAPRLSLLDVAGTHWSLETYLDPAGESSPKGFLVAFMASWCQYCTESLPTLVKLERANPDLAVITVTVDDRPELQKAELEKVRSAGLTGPVLVADEATVLAWIGGGKSVPRYYFVNHEGVVTGQDQGFGDNVAPMMPNQAKRALAD
ncbi:MAG: TlpA disulfide reductase family protein [Pseudomonadota bacterium]|nr:TlpA disulfide reductase family protein [Pseudomonadota bacterium]